MIELDAERLRAVHDWAESRIAEEERKKRLVPLMEALGETLTETMNVHVPDVIAVPEANLRQAVKRMEDSVATFPTNLAAADAEREARLAVVRSRTAALREWLERLS